MPTHSLVCGSCGNAAHLGPSLVADALVAGKLDLARSRAAADRAVGAWSPHADGWPVHQQEAHAAMWKRRLIEILPQAGVSIHAAYAAAWSAVATLVVISLAFGVLLVAASNANPPGGSALASGPVRPTAAGASPVPAGPTVNPTEDPNVRSSFFTAWLSMYRTFVLPCYEQGECALDGTVNFDDGSTAKFDAEVTRIVAMYRASDGLTFGATSDCEQEHGAALALFSAIEAEITVIKATRPADTLPAWQPALAVAWESCWSGLPTDTVTSKNLTQLLKEVRVELVKAKKALSASDWKTARTEGENLGLLAIKLARVSGRDLKLDGTPAAGPVRTLAGDLLVTAGRLQVRRLAAAKGTLADINREIKAVAAIKP